jgi:hypothetical protein
LAITLIKWVLGLGVLTMLAALAGLAFTALYHPVPSPTYTSTQLVPLGTADPTPAGLPSTVSLAVPFTSQAPLMNWAARQHDCEEATLVMVDTYLRGDRSGAQIDPQVAETAINRITPWKQSVDLTDDQLGRIAKEHLGWNYRIYPATLYNIELQLSLGRPVIVGVTTHGLGNPEYPGYLTHHEQPDWSVSHYLVVAGYDSSGKLILNDPGITHGHGYRITFAQLVFAIDDLDRAYPALNQGRIFLVLAPPVSP